MKLTNGQHLKIMNEYDQLRRDNQRVEEERRYRIYRLIPEIRSIDEDIAHLSVSRTKHLLFLSDEEAAEGEKAYREKIARLSMDKADLLVLHNYPPDYLDPVYTCPVCRDTGYVGSEKCGCFKEKIHQLLIEQSNLSAFLETDNFHHFRTDYYSDSVPKGESVSPKANIRHVLNQADEYLRDIRRGRCRNLLIRGKTGTGKTFLSHCIGAELLAAGKNVLYLTAYQLFEQLADFAFRRNPDNKEILPEILNCDVLILDDLGTEFTNNFVNSQLFLCINERILKNRSTIISTNLSLEQLSKVYNERISSRIIESYTILYLFGEDIRIRKALTSLDGK